MTIIIKSCKNQAYFYFLLHTSVKKITILILALLYITTSSGITVFKHYCMGQLISSSISHSNDVYCANCGMKEVESKGCCNDEQQFTKIDNGQKKATPPFQIALFTSSDLTNVFFELPPCYFPSIVETRLLSNALLKDKNLPIFVLNCVFRIWVRCLVYADSKCAYISLSFIYANSA